MDAETLQRAWEWLLGLSKIQLILLGSAVALLVAVSKVMRFLFLLVVVLIFLIVFLPQLIQKYEGSPLPAVIKEFVREGVEATQDPPSPQPNSDVTKKTQEGP